MALLACEEGTAPGVLANVTAQAGERGSGAFQGQPGAITGRVRGAAGRQRPAWPERGQAEDRSPSLPGCGEGRWTGGRGGGSLGEGRNRGGGGGGGGEDEKTKG